MNAVQNDFANVDKIGSRDAVIDPPDIENNGLSERNSLRWGNDLAKLASDIPTSYFAKIANNPPVVKTKSLAIRQKLPSFCQYFAK